MSSTPHNSDSSDLLEESVEELYEQAPCGYLTTTADGRIVKANRTLAEWLGFDRDELTAGRRFTDLLTVGGRIFFETHISLLLRVQDSVNEIALDLLRKDGRTLPVFLNARQKRSLDGSPLLNRYTIFNSIERRLYERQLLAARDEFQTTLSSIGDAVVATDADGRIKFLNPVAESLSGWKTEDAVGQAIERVLDLRRENALTEVKNPIRQALVTGEVVGLENHTMLFSKDGRVIPIDDSASPIRDANGNITGGVLVFRDISERRRSEAALREVLGQLEVKAAELKRSNEELSRFAHIASHDLRSPLNTIAQFTELIELEHGEALGEGREFLQVVIAAAVRMRRLIDDLLSYATSGTEPSNGSDACDANKQLDVAIENLRSVIAETGASVTHDDLPRVAISETHLIQLFQNLVGNAIHYRSSEAPAIHLSSRDAGEFWLFTCRDNGIGIAPEFHVKIFEAFKRLHGPDHPGSGIGLALCKRIVEARNGKIWVESAENEGSTFFFTLPKAT